MTSAASRPAPPPIPSHSQFLRAQIKSSLAHLYTTNDLDEGSYRKIDSILSGNETTSPETTSRETNDDELKVAAKKLATDKNWLRHVLTETDLIANTVSMALSVAVPSAILGGAQKAAIVELVTLSQKKIANAITDAKWQIKPKDAPFAGAKGAGLGIKKGFNAAGQSLEGVSKKRDEMKRNAEAKKAEKREQKEIQRELKREKQEIVQKRQGALLGEGESASRRSTGDDNNRRSSIAGSAVASGDSALAKGSLPRDASYAISEVGTARASDMEGEAMVSVSCSELLSQGSVAATTTFSPWPGLLLTSTLVATNDDDDDERDDDDDEKITYDGELQQNGPRLSESGSKVIDSTGAIAPPPRRPAPSLSGTVPHFPQQDTNEASDTSESKQKSWTKKLGL